MSYDTDVATKKARTSGPSGKNTKPGRMLHQDPEALAEQDAAAADEGVSWAAWIRDAAAQKLARAKRKANR